MTTSTFSVVIPMYNSEKTILNTLSSVKNQSLQPFETIIIDDGSTDKSADLVEEFIQQNNGINIIFIKKSNGGVSTARNAGMKISKGEWIALLDSDDEWLPNKLERQLEVITGYPNIDFLGTTRNNEKINRILWKKIGPLTRISSRLLLIKFIFVVPTIILRKKIITDIGYFDENQKYAEEGNFFIRICNKYNCYLLNESLVITGSGKPHFGQSGLSANLIEMEKGELKNIKDAFNMHILNVLEFNALRLFSLLKYVRRILIVKTRTLC
jgi:glycosyltransferase involved in cell wall biosynthesis